VREGSDGRNRGKEAREGSEYTWTWERLNADVTRRR